MLRALIHALSAQTALLKVDVCQVVLKRDCLKRAGLDALSATDATNLTGLLGYRTLILVNATYIDTAVQFVLVTLPGVTIGDGAVIGAGSVVTHDIPENVLAAGNPCKIIRPIDESDSVYKKKDLF